MKQFSLRFRLGVLSFASISLALVLTTYALNNRFFDYFEGRINSELEQHLQQLATNLSLTQTNAIAVAPLGDRRFDQPFSGLYWQVSVVGGNDFLSRSLWGKSVDLPDDIEAGQRFQSRAKSPTGSQVLVSGWAITVGQDDTEQTVILAVAADEAEVQVAAEGFRLYLIKWLGLMMVCLIAAAWIQISVGLAPLNLIKRKIEQVKQGTNSRLTGRFPSEVKPLVEEVNTLLDAHENSLSAARAKASDLAHGLKTPLTVMRALLDDTRSEISPENLRAIEEQISAMHQFIERELVRSRNDFTRRQIPVGPGVDKMVASMKKLPRGDGIIWEVDIDPELTIPFDQHDLAEMLGNILDNARKWAAGNVTVTGGASPAGRKSITVCDDGPGVPEQQKVDLTSRGTTAPNSEPGHGLGLTITKDLIETVGGNIGFRKSPHGGLTVELTW